MPQRKPGYNYAANALLLIFTHYGSEFIQAQGVLIHKTRPTPLRQATVLYAWTKMGKATVLYAGTKIGVAINMAISTSIKNSLESKLNKLTGLAPYTFLIPNSLVRCSEVNSTRPNNPRHDMNMARNAK